MLVPALRRLVVGAVALTLGLPATALAAEPGITPMGFTSGKQVPETSTLTDALQNAPAGHRWVRMFFDWSQTEHADNAAYDNGFLGTIDARVKAYNEAGVKIAITVQSPPSWAPSINSDAGAQKYAEFMHDMAARYRGKVAVWELWNEPDDGIFWPEGPKADRYAAMLKATYPAVKKADPAAAVIVGGLVGNDFEFLEQLYGHGAGQSFDGVGVHLDTSCRIDPPGVYYREPSGRIGRYAFTGYREVHATLAAHGDADKPIYMTEIGWSNDPDRPCADGRDKANGVSADKQADFLKQAFACIAADPYVKMASWYTLQDSSPTNRFGLYDLQGEKRPALAALKAVGDGTGAGVDRSCGPPVDRDEPVVTLNAPATYFTTFSLSGTVSDASPILRVQLFVDGKLARAGLKSPDYEMLFGGAKALSYGAHTIEVRATDEAQNTGVATMTVTRVNPATASRVAVARFSFTPKAVGLRFRFKARALPPADGSAAERPKGRVAIFMQRRNKGKWNPPSRVRFHLKSNGRIPTYTSPARMPGQWRVWAVLQADAPYKKIKTAPVPLTLR